MEDGGEDLMAPAPNVERIMHTARLWFVACATACAIVLGLLLQSGWRPALLDGGLVPLWWIGAGVTWFSLGLLAWSGCPILEVSVPVANRNKTRTMQLGTLLFLLGSAAALLAVLLGTSDLTFKLLGA